MPDERTDLLTLLRDPPAAYRPAMFWLLNGRLTADLIREQIRQMHERGCGGFFLHPMGESFRLADFISGIEPPYLSDGYFELVRVAVEEADRLGLFAWLYDEGGWPSGHAQGKVVAGDAELRSRVLRVGGRGEPVAEVRLGDRTLSFTMDDGGYPVDTLNPDATARFIELTHERYADAVGEFFGGTIPGIFTDEVAVSGEVGGDAIPWTPGMLEEFEGRRGFDLTPWLPVLFGDDALGVEPLEHFAESDIAAVRCEFCNLWTDLFEEAYFQPINRWCEEHGLIHTGHVGGEDNLPDHRRGFGHFFRTAGALHAPGIDAIWRQIFPGEAAFGFPRLAASAPAQRGGDALAPPWRNTVISESFAVYGYSLTPDQMRWVADYQFARGVSYMAPMALYSDTSGGHWIATMSHLGEGNPLWDSFPSFADHCAALSAAVRQSDPVADVAVYYPIEAAWLGGEAMEAAWESLQAVCVGLESRQVAFDFIDARTLAAAKVADGFVATPGQLYGAVIVPETPVLPVGALETLADLREAGGRVAVCGAPPQMRADYGAGEAFDAALARLLADAVEMDAARVADEMGGDDPRGLGQSMMSIFDGFTVAALGPGRRAQFTDREAAEGACLIVPREEIGRLAELLLMVIGRLELQLDRPEPDLVMSSRIAGDMLVHILHNEGEREIDARLMLVSDRRRIAELWDTLIGEPLVVAVHEEISDPTYFSLRLPPGASALITTRPPHGAAPGVAEEPSLLRINTEVRARSIEVVREAVITAEGDLELRDVSYVPDQIPADFALRPLEELGLKDFSGTVRYGIDLYVPPSEVRRRLFLDLGEVGCVARAWLNGEELGESAWPPHRVEVTGLAVRGINELVVEVTNTLANQAAREDVVEMARERGWMNRYYERVLPWMREGVRSGLIGPVAVLLEEG